MERKRKIFGLILIGMLLVFWSCATLNLTPKQAAAWMNNVYAAQYDEYLTWFDVIGKENGNPIYQLKAAIPEKQKKILQVKKKIFKELQPLLKSYSGYVASGSKSLLIGQTVERAVELIDQLIQMEGGK